MTDIDELPDPGRAGSLDDLAEALRALKTWAGDPSYDTIRRRITAAWRDAGRPAVEQARRATVADCFRSGRRRVNADLVVAIVETLHPDPGYVAQWRQALQVAGGEARPAAQVRVQDTLPAEAAAFTGRVAEVDRLRRALRTTDTPVLCTITGTAGVGKTQLALQAARDGGHDRVLFVDLRGFHPDPAQPPADPAAVLDGFLRLLGLPGQQIPHDLPGRIDAYRARLAGTRTLVVLDNAADAAQAEPLLTATPGCPVLVTSRRMLHRLRPTDSLTVEVFSPADSAAYVARAASGVPVGDDPRAADRIGQRCGHLPLALGLIAAHIRAAPGWTLTDHADRLDERHEQRRLDTAVTLAIGVSYRNLSPGLRRLLRLGAGHPGPDLDDRAVAALTGTALAAARANLRALQRDHLLQQSAPGRYTLHDLIRAYAMERSTDEDPPPQRNAALTRLFDHYLAAAAAALGTIAPAERHRRPSAPAPGPTTPELTDLTAARAWLETERTTLVAVVGHAAEHGWPGHATRLSATLFRWLNGGNPTDALAIHGYAVRAARQSDDRPGEATARAHLGVAHLRMGRFAPARDQLHLALRLFRQLGDVVGQGSALDNLAQAEERQGRLEPAAAHARESLRLLATINRPTMEARALISLGLIEQRLGRLDEACAHLDRAVVLLHGAGDQIGEANARSVRGEILAELGRHAQAAADLDQALEICRELGNTVGEAWTLDSLGTLHLRLGCPAEAADHYGRALAAFKATGQRDGEAFALNGLGEAALLAGQPDDSAGHHAQALSVSAETGDRLQQARAHTGLGRAYDAAGRSADGRRHAENAVILYTDLGVPRSAVSTP